MIVSAVGGHFCFGPGVKLHHSETRRCIFARQCVQPNNILCKLYHLTPDLGLIWSFSRKDCSWFTFWKFWGKRNIPPWGNRVLITVLIAVPIAILIRVLIEVVISKFPFWAPDHHILLLVVSCVFSWMTCHWNGKWCLCGNGVHYNVDDDRFRNSSQTTQRSVKT